MFHTFPAPQERAAPGAWYSQVIRKLRDDERQEDQMGEKLSFRMTGQRTAAAVAAVLLMAAGGTVRAGTSRVLVVINRQSQASTTIGRYYAAKRGVPERCICEINVPPQEQISLADYHAHIRKPVMECISSRKLSTVDFIVTTKGVPLKDERGYSVDSMLTVAAHGMDNKQMNPYFAESARFHRASFGGMFLVTRLDGYTVADAKGLVDRALKCRGKRGKILLDLDPMEDRRPGYVDTNQDIRQAALGFISNGTPYILESTPAFAAGKSGLMGYYTWGSNDSHYNRAEMLSNKFVPGAIAETVVSTSARTFQPATGGQSLIADMVQNGVTGVKGYTSEPYSSAMARAGILFDRYLNGYTLAESFYMASPFLCWKDVVVGDPLAAPYAAGN